jgi:predicted  nucleic acid-binding Zn-ribbon protein
MGPTNVALVKLFQADQALRHAQGRLDDAQRNVRAQERKVSDLQEKLTALQNQLREQQSSAAALDLDIKSRDAHIERLREQQKGATNSKVYQTFLVEINTAKVDRGKIEDEAIEVMAAVEKTQQELSALTTQVDAERGKLTQMQQQIGDTVAKLKAEVDALRPARDAAAAALPEKALVAFERLASHEDGEAMAAIAKPDRRREEYICTVCNMDLVTDVYNKLHSRDEMVFCPSCKRILFIPADLPPELAVNKPKESAKRRTTADEAAPSGA